MPRIDVHFTVTEQVLRQYPPTLLRAGDRNYFYATFDVCEKWADVADLRAVFERGDLERPYVQDLVQGNGCYECVIPWEVMQTPGIVRVGIFGGDRILTNKVDVSVSVGCRCDGDTPKSPTRDWFLRIEELIQELGTPDPAAIAAVVAEYIAANPIEEKDPTVPAWAKTEKKPEYSAEEVGAIAKTELPTAINTALAQAKESGEFDGADGQPGENGTDGYSPTANVTQNDNGATITITDKNGTTTATVKNGKDGADGNPGADGSPGKDGADGKSAYQYAVVGGYTGTEAEFAAKLAAEIPTVDDTLTQSGQAADAAAVGDTIRSLSEEIVTTSESKVAAHNTGTDTHSDIRLLIQGLTDKLNALADSDDTTLDQLSEVVAYIKSNRSLIEAITTSKVSVADIVDNLTTNVSNKPLSAAQGVVIKTLIDALRNDKLDAAELTNAVNTALAQAKASGEFDGADGKSAYQYAQEGGYTGTETAFAKKLASELLLVNITESNGTLSADKTFIEIRDAILAGIPVLVDHDGAAFPLIVMMADFLWFGSIKCANDDAGTIVYTEIIDITQNGEVNDLSAYVEIPTTLPNPNALTFTGAVTGTYDGSAPLSVNIPSAVTDAHINELINTALNAIGVAEEGAY